MPRSTPVVHAPYSHFHAVTTSDSTAQPDHDAIMVGVTGNVVIIDDDGVTTTIKNMTQGVIYPIRAAKIKATSTTATDIVLLKRAY